MESKSGIHECTYVHVAVEEVSQDSAHSAATVGRDWRYGMGLDFLFRVINGGEITLVFATLPDLGPKWVRLAPNEINMGLFKIISVYSTETDH